MHTCICMTILYVMGYIYTEEATEMVAKYLQRIAHYYKNGFEEDIYIYIYIYR